MTDLTPDMTPGLTPDLNPDLTPDLTSDLTPDLTPDAGGGSKAADAASGADTAASRADTGLARVPRVPRVQRVFLGWDRPALPLAMAHLMATHARMGVKGGFRQMDLSKVLVVVPGQRARARLLELLLEDASARGVALVPPDVCSVGEFPERRYVPRRPHPPVEVEEAAWRKAFRALSDTDLNALVSTPPAPDDLPGWTALATMAGQLHRTLGAELIHFDDVARRCGALDLLHNDEVRWRALARVQRSVRQSLEAAGFEDRDASRRAALREGLAPNEPDAEPTTLVLLGLVDLSLGVRDFVHTWPGEVEALIHAPANRSEGFDALGAINPQAWEGRSLRIPPKALLVVNRPEDQAREVLRWLRRLEGRYAAEEITVGVPDPEVVPFLSGAFERAGVPSRDAEGRPMHRTAPFRLLEAVAAFLDGRRYEDLAALVRHPDFRRALARKSAVRGGAVVASADGYHALHLPAGFPEKWRKGSGVLEGEGSGERLGETMNPKDRPGALLRQVQDGIERLLPAKGLAPLSAWANALEQVILNLHPPEASADEGAGERMVDRFAPDDRELARFCAVAARVLEGFRVIPPALADANVSFAQAIRALLARVRDEAVPDPADEGAVERLGWLELPMDDAPVLVVTGVNEPYLPESVTGDPFLPHALRAGLGLPDNRFRRARDQALLEAMLHSRAAVCLVAGRRDGSGNPLRPSRLLLAEEPEVMAERLVDLLGAEPEGATDVVAATAPNADAVPTVSPAAAPEHPRLSFPPEPVLSRPEGPPGRISVTDFRRVLNDPYRYALESILGLERVTDEAREMDPMRFGNLAHAVLESWAVLPGADQQSEAEIVDALEALLEARFEAWFGTRPLPALRIQNAQLRMRLRGMAPLQAQRNADGWRIVGVEVKSPGDGVPFEVDGVPILVRGRVDRIDHHPETNSWQLLDVKTSEKGAKPETAHRRGRSGQKVWIDLQLPLYHRILAPALQTPDTETPLLSPTGRIETGFLCLPMEAPSLALSPWTEAELDEALDVAADVVRTVRHNRFEWDPAARRFHADDPLAEVVGQGLLFSGNADDSESESEDDA